MFNVGLKDIYSEKLRNSLIMLNPFEDSIRYEDLFHDHKTQKATSIKSKGIGSNPREKKLKIFFERLYLVREKMLRHSKYIFKHQQNTKFQDNTDQAMPITGIGSLLGTKGHKNALGILL